MAQSLAKIFVHLVFSTKYRAPLIKSDIDNELYSYIGGIITGLGGIPIIINGVISLTNYISQENEHQ